MDEKRFCRFCGAHLIEGAKFCTNCGAIVTKPPIQPAEPRGLWSYVQSLWSRFWATSATKQPYKIMAGGVVVLLILLVLGTAASSSNTGNPASAVQSKPLPTAAAPTKVAITPTATPKPVTTPTPLPKPVDYSAQISATYRVYLITPFYKTTVNGREAYVGDVSDNGVLIHFIIYPTKTLADATNYKEQLIQSYKAQGYKTYKITEDAWYGILGINMHTIDAYDTKWGFPATIDENGNAS
jgi:hypothetical protein